MRFVTDKVKWIPVVAADGYEAVVDGDDRDRGSKLSSRALQGHFRDDRGGVVGHMYILLNNFGCFESLCTGTYVFGQCHLPFDSLRRPPGDAKGNSKTMFSSHCASQASISPSCMKCAALRNTSIVVSC